jgi:hypothetical protein
MRSRTNPKIDVRLWQGQFVEEDLRHVVVIMLTRVYQGVLDERVVLQLCYQGSDFGQIGPCSDNTEDVQNMSPSFHKSISPLYDKLLAEFLIYSEGKKGCSACAVCSGGRLP